MKDNSSQNVTRENEVKGRGLFYGVIAIAVFIIMAVGTTFAYFTATTNSADTSVKTGSTTLRLKYIGYEGAWMNRDLIPANTEVVEYSFEYQDDTTVNTDEDHADYAKMRYNAMCKDDYGNSICSVYVFQIKNEANSPQAVSLNVVTTTNEFANLNAMAYEISAPDAEDTEHADYEKYFPIVPEDGEEAVFVDPLNGSGDPIFKQTEDETLDGVVLNDVRDGDGNFLTPDAYTPVYVNRNGVTKTLLSYNKSATEVLPAIDMPIKIIDPLLPEEKTAKIADNITIPDRGIKTFALVLYIKNINEDQTDADAEKTFSGQVVVSSGDGKVGVSGTIGIEGSKNLQSGTLFGTPTPEEPEPEPTE